MTALESATSPAASGAAAENVVIFVRGLTKVFKDCSLGVVNLNSQVDPVRARGARPSGRFSVRQRWGVRTSSSLSTVQRPERHAPLLSTGCVGGQSLLGDFARLPKSDSLNILHA